MLEFKNVSVALPDGRRSQPFSLVVTPGEMVCLCGAADSGAREVLMAVMGLVPVASGYITIDGELVCAGSADYFRHLMSYVPEGFPDAAIKVSELCRSVLGVHLDAADEATRKALMLQWQGLGLAPELYDRSLREVSWPLQQPAMLGMIPLLKRPIVLIDNLQQTETAARFLHDITAQGIEVVYTCADNQLPCNQLVKL